MSQEFIQNLKEELKKLFSPDPKLTFELEEGELLTLIQKHQGKSPKMKKLRTNQDSQFKIDTYYPSIRPKHGKIILHGIQDTQSFRLSIKAVLDLNILYLDLTQITLIEGNLQFKPDLPNRLVLTIPGLNWTGMYEINAINPQDEEDPKYVEASIESVDLLQRLVNYVDKRGETDKLADFLTQIEKKADARINSALSINSILYWVGVRDTTHLVNRIWKKSKENPSFLFTFQWICWQCGEQNTQLKPRCLHCGAKLTSPRS